MTKLDPTGTKMIFSTAVSGTGNTMNRGLAVDAVGNVYLTGIAGAGYPYTVAATIGPAGPALDVLAFPALPYLTKLDPLGQKLIYSVPVGGTGVALDANGNAYTGGLLGVVYPYDMDAALPVLANIPSGCVSAGGAYAAEVDGSGNIFGSQYIGGSVKLSGVALNSSTLWLAGSAGVNIPFTPGAVMSPNLIPSQAPGAYLGAVNFGRAQPPAGTPQVACVLDAADFALAGPIVPLQLLTIMGSGLGPAAPVNATDNSTTTLGGVSVNFGSLQAPLLYVSTNQINVAVPLVEEGPSDTTFQVAVNGVSTQPIEYPVTPANPEVFIVPGTFQFNLQQFSSVALNADGSANSAANPAALGSVVTVFVNGIAPDPQDLVGPAELSTGNGWSIVNVSQATPFVTQLELRVPSANMNFVCQIPNTSACIAGFRISDAVPYILPGSQPNTAPGPSFGGSVWVQP